MRNKTTAATISSLESGRDRIHRALVALTTALAKRETAQLQIDSLKREIQTALRTLDPGDLAAVDAVAVLLGRLGVLEHSLAASCEVRESRAGLESAIRAVRAPVEEAAQGRSIEEAAASTCGWWQTIQDLERRDEQNQIAVLRSAADVVLADIKTILAGRRGMLLTNEERLSACLKVEGRGVVRRLTPVEVATGFADE